MKLKSSKERAKKIKVKHVFYLTDRVLRRENVHKADHEESLKTSVNVYLTRLKMDFFGPHIPFSRAS